MELDDDELVRRIRRDLADSYDEEFELELEDRNQDGMAESEVNTETEAYRASRKLYFHESGARATMPLFLTTDLPQTSTPIR